MYKTPPGDYSRFAYVSVQLICDMRIGSGRTGCTPTVVPRWLEWPLAAGSAPPADPVSNYDYKHYISDSNGDSHTKYQPRNIYRVES